MTSLDRDLGWEEIAEVIEDAYLTVAHAKLIKAASGDRGRVSRARPTRR